MPQKFACLSSLLSAHNARPWKIPGWIVVVRENTSGNKQTYRKQTIEIVLRGFSFVLFFKFYIGFHGFHLKKLKLGVLMQKVGPGVRARGLVDRNSSFARGK